MRRPLPCVHFKSQEPLQIFARVSLARTVTPRPPGGHWQVDQQHCDGLPPLGSILQGCGTGLTQVSWRRNPRTTLPTGTWKGWYGAHSRVSAVGVHPRSHVPSMFKHVKSKNSLASVFPLEFQILTSLCQTHIREDHAWNKSTPIWIHLKPEIRSLLWQPMYWKPVCHFSGVRDTEVKKQSGLWNLHDSGGETWLRKCKWIL